VNQPVEIPNINVNVDLTVAALQNVVVDSGTVNLVIDTDGTVRSRIRVRWDAVTSYFVLNGGRIEWQYRTSDMGSGAGPWLNAAPCAGNATTLYIQPVEDGVSYNLRGRAISQLGRRGTPTAVLSHVVVGKTEPPPDVDGFGIDGTVLNCLPVDILDLAGYVLRFHYGNNTEWATATPINSGVITQFPFDLVARPIGLTTLMVKAVDTTGNESLNPATIFANLIAPRIANMVYEYPFHPLFSGVLSGCFVLDAELLANVDGGGYAQLQYTSGIVVVAGIPANCTMHLPIEYEGEGLTIEYRQTGPGSFFGEAGTDPHFGASGADPYFGPAGPWLPWPGVLAAANDGYEFRFTIAAGAVRGVINTAALRVSAPPVSEIVPNYPIDIAGSTIPHTAGFTRINSVQATLQAGTSGARTIEVDTSNPLAPKVYAFDSSHNLVGGASADLTLEGY
jgi:hypothetical protein